MDNSVQSITETSKPKVVVKECSTCIWSDMKFKDDANVYCIWPLVTGHKLPAWMKKESYICSTHFGKTCPCWEHF